jgi:hypothetical protein
MYHCLEMENRVTKKTSLALEFFVLPSWIDIGSCHDNLPSRTFLYILKNFVLESTNIGKLNCLKVCITHKFRIN